MERTGTVALAIEDYALVGDAHGAALIGRDGSVDWLCLPRFDSSAVFAALLDTPAAGRWLLAPAAGGSSSRWRYRGDSLVLETDWETSSGHARVVDLMPPKGEASDLVRIVEGVSGSMQMRTELIVRFGDGKIVPWTQRLTTDAGSTSPAPTRSTSTPRSSWPEPTAPPPGPSLCAPGSGSGSP